MINVSDITGAAKVLLDAGKLPEYKKLLEASEQLLKLQEELAEKTSQVKTLQAEIDEIRSDQVAGADFTKVRDHYRDNEGNIWCA